MNHDLKRIKKIMVVASAERFVELMRWSGAIFSKSICLIPIQCEQEALQILENPSKTILIVDPEFSTTSSQEKIIRNALAQGINWCPIKIYAGHLIGYAQVENIKDLLEWMGGMEEKKESLLVGKGKCILRRFLALQLNLLFLPVFVIIAILIKGASRGPVIFRQTRVGLKGKSFTLYKFRTMHLDAEQEGPQWSSGDQDPRTFPIGRFLRKTHLDELPQLWNVIKGDLCFIGPRPERPEFHNALEDLIPHFTTRTIVKPGITGWAQLLVGYAASVEDSKRKADHDLFYIRNSTPKMAMFIILRTVKKIAIEIFKWVLKQAAGSKLPSLD